MPSHRKHHRLRLRTPRWPSKDHREFQTVGCVMAWRARRSQPAAPAPVLDDRLGGGELPILSSIVRMRRVDAMLHVEIRAGGATVDARPLVSARDGAVPASVGAAPVDGPSVASSAERTWTVSLPLN